MARGQRAAGQGSLAVPASLYAPVSSTPSIVPPALGTVMVTS